MGRNWTYSFFFVVFFFYTSSSIASYLYNQKGDPVFVKLYIDLERDLHPLIDFPILSDEEGRFFAAMIQFGYWICPYCGILNPVAIAHCNSPHCDSQKGSK